METHTELETVMRKHQPRLWAYLRFLGCGPTAAEDLLQETFLTFLRKPFENRGDASTAAYLRAIARNHFLTALRGAKRRREIGLGDSLDTKGAKSRRDLEVADEVWARNEEECPADDRRLALRKCMETLDERSRRTLMLRYEEELGGANIAKELNTTEHAINGIIKRARARLRECVKRRLA